MDPLVSQGVFQHLLKIDIIVVAVHRNGQSGKNNPMAFTSKLTSPVYEHHEPLIGKRKFVFYYAILRNIDFCVKQKAIYRLESGMMDQ